VRKRPSEVGPEKIAAGILSVKYPGVTILNQSEHTVPASF